MPQSDMQPNLSQAALLEKAKTEPLTPAEHLLAYGDPGPPLTTMFNIRDGRLISRLFGKGEKIPAGWEDSPAKFGIETEPAASPEGEFPEDASRFTVPAKKAKG